MIYSIGEYYKLIMTTRNFLAFLLMIFIVQAEADFVSGGEAYKKGDYETAAKEFLPLAEKGDHRAMYALGSMYSVGHGVPQDLNEALKWFLKAASYGRPDAEYKLGIMHAQGLGVPQDYRKAINWYGKAAKKGYSEAQYKIGLMYAEGHGVTQDDIKAYAWLQTALSQGVSEAQDSLSATASKLTPEQLTEAQALAQSYQEKYIKRR